MTPANLWTILFLIAKDPLVQKSLHEELAYAEKQGEIPSRLSILSDEQARGLPYLSACVQEALRYAPTISQLPRLSPRGDGLVLHGRYVPPGYSVSTSPWIIGRNISLYGDDANTYRPGRWLEASPSQIRRWHRNSFHFGYGSRKCVARPFALIQIYKAMAEVSNIPIHYLVQSRVLTAEAT